MFLELKDSTVCVWTVFNMLNESSFNDDFVLIVSHGCRQLYELRCGEIKCMLL